MGIRKQETERRNVKAMAQVEDGWMFTGQKRNNFGVSSQNSEDGKTFNQTQVREYPQPDGLPFFYFVLNQVFNGEMVKWRNEEYKTELGCCTCRLNHTEKIRPQRE